MPLLQGAKMEYHLLVEPVLADEGNEITIMEQTIMEQTIMEQTIMEQTELKKEKAT